LSAEDQYRPSTEPSIENGPDRHQNGSAHGDKTASQPFVHPTEAIFAKIMDFYGITWQYEPRTFPLAWDAQGNVIEAFAPDFYLPGQDLYIELTTLRPKLANYKNRRIRRMQELYPDVHIKLIKRHEMRTMMVKYGLYDEAEALMGTGAQNKAEE
jgi:hypothetical protein